MRTLLGKLKPTAEDVFYDLGSGVGKFPIYVHLVCPDIKKVVGIEAAASRHHEAKQALARLIREGAIDTSREVTFVHGDIVKEDISDATIIFICATCFPEPLMQALADRFLTLKPGLRIVTLKALPERPRLKMTKKAPLPTSWSQEGSMMYFYELL